MPRIPLAARPQPGGHQESTVPLSGAPSLGWNTDNGLEQLGNAITHGSGAIGKSIFDGVDASLILAAEKQRADDEDNFSQIRLEATREYNDFHSRTRENPNEYENFPKWRQETDERISEKVRPYLEKLSTPARKRAEFFLADAQLTQEKFARDIAFQADVTTKREHYDTRIRHYAKTGDLNAAETELNQAVQTGVFSENDIDRYKNFIGELADFGEVERRIDADDPEIAGELSARDGERFLHFTNLTGDDRRQLLRYAEQKQARREAELYDKFAADVRAGANVSEESVLARTDIRQGIKNDFIKILRSVRASEAAQRERERSQQETQRKQARKHAFDALEFEIMEHVFPADPVERDKAFAAFNRRIHMEFAADDPAYATRLKKQLRDCYQAAMTPDNSYKNSPSYQYGKNLIDQMAAQGKFFAQEPGGWWGPQDTEDLKTAQYTEKLVRLDLDHYLRNHPEATETEIRDLIVSYTEDYNKTLVDELAERALMHTRASTKQIPREGQSGTFNGKKVIFKNGKWIYQ